MGALYAAGSETVGSPLLLAVMVVFAFAVLFPAVLIVFELRDRYRFRWSAAKRSAVKRVAAAAVLAGLLLVFAATALSVFLDPVVGQVFAAAVLGSAATAVVTMFGEGLSQPRKSISRRELHEFWKIVNTIETSSSTESTDDDRADQ